jgi:hypothetical protein
VRRGHVPSDGGLRLIIAALLAVLLLGGCGENSHASGAGPIVGLADGASGWGGASTATRLDTLQATGTHWLRDSFLWSKIEPRPGRFVFAYYDHYMLEVASRRLHVVALLDNTPSWAGATPETIPKDPSAYAAYVAAVVARYGPSGSFWRRHPMLRGSAIRVFELWNEPYFNSGNAGDWDPAAYANLVKAADIAGHHVDPRIQFLLEAEMQAHQDRVWTWWVDALYQAVPNLNYYFNGVAVHDYGYNLTTVPTIIRGEPYDGYGDIFRIFNLRQQFIAHHAANKPFWITEAGWSTCTQRGPDCVSEAQQARNLKTLFGYVRGRWRKWVRAVLIYRYGDGSQPSTVQDAYGLVHLNGKPKPALSVFRAQALRSG